MVHQPTPTYLKDTFISPYSLFECNQESSTNERLPEENVSIVETMEGREDFAENFGPLAGTTRKKLYFNPAYFEPQLLLVSIIFTYLSFMHYFVV